MIRFDAERADAPVALGLLADYFGSRELSFPGGAAKYRISYPDPAAFTPPQGVFLVLREVPGSAPEGSAEEGDAVALGCGGIRRIADLDGEARYEVKHLWLAPDTRGRGWGRRMLEELESRARGFGAAWLVLDTNEVLAAAGGLYRSSGFEQVEPYNDNPNATTWYAKRLVER